MNKKKDMIYWEIAGFLFTVIIGTILHFVYNWTNQNSIAAIFSPVNESTGEHLKLIFFPMLIFSIVEYFTVRKEIPNYAAAKSFGILSGMLFITAAFYTYTGITGMDLVCADILIFVLGVAAAYKLGWRMMKNSRAKSWLNIVGLLLIAVAAVMFIAFTFSPPQIPLFADPNTKNYGTLKLI